MCHVNSNVCVYRACMSYNSAVDCSRLCATQPRPSRQSWPVLRCGRAQFASCVSAAMPGLQTHLQRRRHCEGGGQMSDAKCVSSSKPSTLVMKTPVTDNLESANANTDTNKQKHVACSSSCVVVCMCYSQCVPMSNAKTCTLHHLCCNNAFTVFVFHYLYMLAVFSLSTSSLPRLQHSLPLTWSALSGLALWVAVSWTSR